MVSNGFLAQNVPLQFGKIKNKFPGQKSRTGSIRLRYIAGGPSPKGGLRMTVFKAGLVLNRAYAVAAAVDARLFIVLRHSSKS